MKTKVAVSIFISFAVVCAIVVLSSQRSQNYEPLTESDTDALTYTECLGDVGKNQGKCARNADGTGSSCVESHWWQTDDCVSTYEM